MGLKNSLKKPIKSLFLKATVFLFLPLLGFVLFSWLTYPLKPHCSLSQGLLGCIPRCEPVSFFEDGNPASYKETPCFHEEPSPFQLAIFNYRLLIPLILFVSVSFWIYKDGFRKVIGKLAYIAFAPFFIFKENRENRNIVSRLLVIIIIFFLVIEWALGYSVVFATFTGKDLFTSSPPQSQTQVAPLSPSFTGQEVFDAVNEYRKENGVSELKLDEVLCNNIAQRYLDIKAGEKENIAHKGFDEWYKKYAEPYGYVVSEDYACGQSPEDIINAWDGSPGHKLSILNEKNKLACAYAFSGCAVLILGYKSSQVKGVNTYSQAKISTPTPDPDPVIDCLIAPECGGGSRQMRFSECNQTTCCQVGDKWYFYLNKNKCTEDQKNYWDSYYSQRSSSIPTYTPLPTPTLPTYYSCTICYPSLGTCSTYNHLYKTKEECDTAQASINQAYPTPFQNYSPTASLNTPSITKKECQSQVNEKYINIMVVQYGCAYPCPETGDCGTSSVCDVLWSQAKKEMDACNQYP